jgi:hypothetical protein
MTWNLSLIDPGPNSSRHRCSHLWNTHRRSSDGGERAGDHGVRPVLSPQRRAVRSRRHAGRQGLRGEPGKPGVRLGGRSRPCFSNSPTKRRRNLCCRPIGRIAPRLYRSRRDGRRYQRQPPLTATASRDSSMQITAPAVLAGALAVASIASAAAYPGRRAPRILGWIAALALCGMVASCLAGCAEGSFVDAPPSQFRGPGFYAVRTVPTAQIATACAGVSTVGERQGVVVGCAKGSVVILPNPCEWSDAYAQLACHEQAHAARGWANDHPH